MTKYIIDRIKEKTSQGGVALIAMGLVVLIAGPFAQIAAYAAIAFGIWQICSKG
tara:strand:- start:111 stop:272 length:162 start_codon:yes stop_codon:yes gene_type:complete